jgi:putative lipoic acid-binding regulatory protein|tara:strand:+ start:2194 stop:2481 length:288 start_codon:yes stop_codon:yes gene_type:complete
MSKNTADEFYDKLKKQLDELTVWPSVYPFKFILPNDAEKHEQLKNCFHDLDAKIAVKTSKTKKYFSFTILVEMPNADAIIDKYKEVTKIDGIISL